jgi:hypothetical protein
MDDNTKNVLYCPLRSAYRAIFYVFTITYNIETFNHFYGSAKEGES